jgi:hypothetical protein
MTRSVGCDRDFGVVNVFLSGGTDEVRLYGRALDANEIAILATL